MTDDWLLPLLVTEEEEKIWNKDPSTTDDQDINTMDDDIDRGLNKYFDLNGI
jgi:hypothetical protein